MKNKKGFTLIELLAVIVILAIIALIATPVILNMVKNAKKSAARSSSLGYIDSVEKYAELSSSKDGGLPIKGYDEKIPKTDKEFITCVYENNVWSDGEGTSGCSKFMTSVADKTKGSKPSKANIIMNKNGKMQDGSNFTMFGYLCTYQNNDVTCDPVSGTNNKKPSNVQLILDEDGNKEPSSGDIVKIGSEYFYVIEETDTKIQLLSKYNLMVGNAIKECDEAHNWNCTLSKVENETGMQSEQAKGYIPNLADIYGVIPYSSGAKKGENIASYKGSIVEEYVNNYIKKLNEMYPELKATGSIISREMLENKYGCDMEANSCTNGEDWIFETSYWIIPAKDEEMYGYLYAAVQANPKYPFDKVQPDENSMFGVRPVLTIEKSIVDSSTAEEKPKVKWTLTKKAGSSIKKPEIGDIITVKNESFYIISANDNEVKALSKYNLEVGDNCIYKPSLSMYVCTKIDNASGLQSERAEGWKTGIATTVGDYGVSRYSVNTNNTTYEKSDIKPFVDQYVKKLEKYGVTINSSGIMSDAELSKFGCNKSTHKCSEDYPWIYSTSYWTNELYEQMTGYSIYGIQTNNNYYPQSPSTEFGRFGTRPVISIPTDEIDLVNIK